MSKRKMKTGSKVALIILCCFIGILVIAAASAIGLLIHFHGRMNIVPIETFDESHEFTMDPDVLQSMLDEFNKDYPGDEIDDETVDPGIFDPENSENKDGDHFRTEPPEIIPTDPEETEPAAPTDPSSQSEEEISSEEPTGTPTEEEPSVSSEPEDPTVEEPTYSPELTDPVPTETGRDPESGSGSSADPTEPGPAETTRTPEPTEPVPPETSKTPEPTKPVTPETSKTPEPTKPVTPETSKTPEPTKPVTPETSKTPEPTKPVTPETSKAPEPTQPTPTETSVPSSTEDYPIESFVVEPVDKDSKVTNILLIGEDANSNRGRTDVMIVVTINNKNKSITLTSMLRDTYVTIPINGGIGERLNASYFLGGVALLKETIKNNFGIQIDNYMKVDFAAVTSVFDHLGGLDVVLDQKEIDYINSHTGSKIDPALAGKPVHLNGKQLLCHVRNRKTISAKAGRSGDWSRTYRQRDVLTVAFAKLKTMSIGEMYKTLDDIFPYVTTDIKYTTFQSYIFKSVSFLKYKIQTTTLPTKAWYYWHTPKGQSVIRISDINWEMDGWKKIVYGE